MVLDLLFNDLLQPKTFNFIQEEQRFFGVDWNGPIPHTAEVDAVEVPETECPLTEEQFDELGSMVSPLADSTNYGIDLYLSTLSFVQHCINCQQ